MKSYRLKGGKGMEKKTDFDKLEQLVVEEQGQMNENTITITIPITIDAAGVATGIAAYEGLKKKKKRRHK